MLRRRIRSALFIDYENVSQRALPDTIGNWLSWLEQGEFDPARRRRRLLSRRIYWNSSAEVHREKFARFGFEAVLCEKFATLKNGADIRMAMDILEATYVQPGIEEFILVTKDSDFIPVLQRLGEKSKRTVMLVDESKPSVHTAFATYADILIPVRKLADATTYVRPRRRWWGWLRRPASPVKSAAVNPDRGHGSRTTTAPPVADPLTQAVNRVVRVASRKPRQYTSQRVIESELRAIPGFSSKGRQSYLGQGSYRALMMEVERRTSRIKVHLQGNGGTGVQYLPQDEIEPTGPTLDRRAGM